MNRSVPTVAGHHMWPLLQGEQAVLFTNHSILILHPDAALRNIAATKDPCIVASGICRINSCHVSITGLAHVHTEGEGGEV